MFTLIASLTLTAVQLITPILPAADAAAPPVVKARLLEIAPNIRLYSLRSSTLLVPVRDQAAFDAAATGFAGRRHSIRTLIHVELTNTTQEPIIISSFGIAGGIAVELVDEQASMRWSLSPLFVGEPADPEPDIFLAPGQPLRHTFVLASALEPAGKRTEKPELVGPHRFPARLTCSGAQTIGGFAAATNPDGAASVKAPIEWSGTADVTLANVSF
jgi:hypothetical protein